MTGAERGAALEAISAEVRACTRCRLHVGRTRAVPGEGNPDTEVVFVGEGPGFNEDRLGRPFVGRAGDLLVDLLGSIGWRREDVFITNVVKCRPPENRDPQADEIAACAPYLTRQLAALDPALVVTLGRHSMARFMPGTTITRAHGTLSPVDPATGAPSAMAYAMYHPAAALRDPAVEAASRADVAGIPAALLTSRARREAAAGDESANESAGESTDESAGTPKLVSTAAGAAAPDPVAEPSTESVAAVLPDEVPRAVTSGESVAELPAAESAAEVTAAAEPAAPPAAEPAGTGSPADDQLTLFR